MPALGYGNDHRTRRPGRRIEFQHSARKGSDSSFAIVKEFVENCAAIEDMAVLRESIQESCRALGFDFFAIIHHIRFGRPSTDKVRLTNYPLEWIAKLREEDGSREPVLRAAERASSGFLWSRLHEHVALGERELDYMKRAATFGLVEGFTVPNHVPGETFGSCNFAVKRRESLETENLPAAQALGCFAFEAARRILQDTHASTDQYLPPAPLTDRQRDCVLFAARGKSDSVIAQLLNIRPRTVNEHIEAAKRRYLVATRTQLIVRALFRSEICFSEVLD
jgi:LuxR family transcriptional regulator, quorum-sensing system regulator CciR